MKQVTTIFTLLITALFFTVLYVAAEARHTSYEEIKVGVRYSVSIPNHILRNNSVSYEQQVDLFSKQLVRAFDISEQKAKQYAPVIIRADIDTGLSEIRIASLIMTESSFNKNAKSSVGALGSTQIRPVYWSNFCDEYNLDIHDFEGNILCGARIVSFLMTKYCDDKINCAFEHYNVGRGNLLSHVKYRQAGMRYTQKINDYSERLISTLISRSGQ